MNGILHWKTMIFVGQNVVEFQGANFSPEAFVYITPYENYEWESIYFTDDGSIVNSFKTWFDNFRIDYTFYADYDRSGNTFTAYQSPDGTTWNLVDDGYRCAGDVRQRERAVATER